MQAMAWSLVCPASRGIGFHLTRHLLQNTNLSVVATARSDVKGVKRQLLDGLDGVQEDRLNVLEVDVTEISKEVFMLMLQMFVIVTKKT